MTFPRQTFNKFRFIGKSYEEDCFDQKVELDNFFGFSAGGGKVETLLSRTQHLVLPESFVQTVVVYIYCSG